MATKPAKPVPPSFDETESIAFARAKVMDHLTHGVSCPVCAQYCKLYKRKLSSGMIKALIKIATVQAKFDNIEIKVWIDAGKLNFQGGDYAKLIWWKLVEHRKLRKDEKEANVKKDSGKWRITPLGRQFLSGEVVVPRYIFIYNNRVSMFSAETTGARDALTDKFNFGELMQNYYQNLSKVA